MPYKGETFRRQITVGGGSDALTDCNPGFATLLYNALRLALMSKRPEAAVRVFLVGNGVVCAKRGQKTPSGYYNVERMLKSLAQRGEVAT